MVLHTTENDPLVVLVALVVFLVVLGGFQPHDRIDNKNMFKQRKHGFTDFFFKF